MTRLPDAPDTPMLIRLAPAGPGRPRRWQDAALCAEVDPDLFFPETGEPAEPAKQVCAGCPVREPCLDYALEHAAIGAWGIWGGMTERDRRKLKRERRRAAA